MPAPCKKHSTCPRIAVAPTSLLFLALAASLSSPAQISVTTYHYDNYRTGWNSNEHVLSPSNVNAASFGLLHTVPLDDQVDAQPLVVPDVMITAGPYTGTKHEVVYVATGNNTVYAIDAKTGVILLSSNFGPPVPYPLGCNNNGPNVGITSTPVIDPASNTLYVMVYTQEDNHQSYYLHALDLGRLSDKVPPRLVAASHELTNGVTFHFHAKYQRQRPALLLANGSVYAGFGSFCDSAANYSRGWLLGWSADTLKPFPSNQLTDLQATDPDDFFLSAIWMSGYGPATDDFGNILFVTGNSDYSGTTYDGVTNIQESVVKVSNTLTTVLDLFTPDNQASLDEGDVDFGSGGVLVLPDQPGPFPHLAVAAGKDGNMYFMDEDNLGGYSPKRNNVLGTYQIGGCFCGESYFQAHDGTGRVVASGNNSVTLWQVQTSPAAALNYLATSPNLIGQQAPGFFTSISSHGTNNAIIWAVSRPFNTKAAPLYLYAFDAKPTSDQKLEPLFVGRAGYWPNLGGNSNLVPVVANGRVFVASNKQLAIFRLTK